MPRAELLVESIGGAQFLSALDKTKGCWQVALSHVGKPKTTFATPSGLYQFKIMLFGLHGVRATFQRFVDTILRDCTI